MIISTYDGAALHDIYGIEMSDIAGLDVAGLGAGAGWGRVEPGITSEAHQHDETETFVIVAGTGVVTVDGAEHPAAPGTVAQFEPFETHTVRNTGSSDLVFATFYGRDAVRAADASVAPAARRRYGDRPTFVFSTPPTPNGDLHLGHLSGPYLGADVFVRFQRLNGADAWHLTGSDDYQSYVVECAQREGASPAATAAHYSAEIAETLAMMDIELDQYTVTDADPIYADGLRGFFSRLAASGSVTPQTRPALRDPETGRYLYEVDVLGACPTCAGGTGGNICEECGEPNSCTDLVAPRTRRTGAAPIIDAETRYTLPLHEFRSDVLAHHRLGRVPARLRDLAARLFRRERIDISITHPADWGVAPHEDGVQGQVIWVWPEMSYGFLHGIEALGARLGRAWRASAPERDWKIVHFFGYDNSFYHAILYPVLYNLAHPGWAPDIDYQLNEFLLLENSKFSTSRRHAIWGKDVLTSETVDAIRFHLAWIRPETERTNFDPREFDSVLADVLIGEWQEWLQDLGARVDAGHGGRAPDAGTWTPEHTAFLGRLTTRLAALSACLAPDGFSLNQAAAELAGIVADVRRFRATERRFAGLVEWEAEARTAIALELAAARLLAECAAPVMPRFSARLAGALGMETPSAWPRLAALVEPGAPVALTARVFFGAGSDAPIPAHPVPAPADHPVDELVALVRTMLDLPATTPVADRRLVDLSMSSLQAVALQYHVLARFDRELLIGDLLGDRTVAELAAELADPLIAPAVPVQVA